MYSAVDMEGHVGTDGRHYVCSSLSLFLISYSFLFPFIFLYVFFIYHWHVNNRSLIRHERTPLLCQHKGTITLLYYYYYYWLLIIFITDKEGHNICGIFWDPNLCSLMTNLYPLMPFLLLENTINTSTIRYFYYLK